ncbi:MAG: hypothetical protein IPQ07_41845 [Myxococcales bacterium]|nr:hypothetical protein [Myxococcales bacterium]
MRLNIQGWDSLELDGRPVDEKLKRAGRTILDKHLGPARVRGVKDLGLFWIASGEKRARPSRVMNVRYVPAKRKVMCRLMLAPTARTARANNLQYVRDMARLTIEVLTEIEARLAKLGTTVDLTACRKAITRDFRKLAARCK